MSRERRTTIEDAASTLKPLLSLLAFRLFVGAIVTVYVPYAILSSHPERSLALPGALAVTGGLVMAAVGAAIYVRCIWDFAVGGQGMAPKVLVARLLVTLYEERALTKEFGSSYAQYRKEVGRWIPKIDRRSP